MKLWSRVVFTLLLTIESVSLASSGDQYLRDEYERVLRDRFEADLDKPLSAKGKEKLDRLFQATPFLNTNSSSSPSSPSSSKRTKRAANEVKEEQLLLDGIMDYGSIPVDFSRHLCMFQVEDLEYAAVVHSTNISNPDNSTRLVIFRKAADREFERIYNISIPYIVSLDCISFGSDGFVSAAVNMKPENQNVHLFSPIFRVQKKDRVEIIEKNSWWRQRSAKLWKYGNDLLLIYTFENDPSFDSIPGAYICPIFKLSAGLIFEIWKEIACSNAIRVEAFTIISDMYVAVANSKDATNNTETYSVVYKFDLNLDKFVTFQNILVNRVMDLRYFTFKISDELANFMVITSAGLIESNEVAEIRRAGFSVVIIYKYVEEIFLPMQNIMIEQPTQVLPHIWEDKEMVLLIASKVAPVRFYHYIGWKFEDTELTEVPTAFETGVSSLKNYVTIKGDSLILLSNSEHFGSTPNLFKFHFRVDEDPDLYEGILEWCDKSITDLRAFDYQRVLTDLEAIHEQQKKILDDLVLNTPVVLDSTNITVKKIVADHVADETFIASMAEHEKMIKTKEIVGNLEEKLKAIGEKIGQSLTKTHRDTMLRSAESREISFEELAVEEIETQFVNGKPFELWAHENDDLFVGSLTADQMTVHGAVNFEEYSGLLQSALRSTGDQVIEYPLVVEEVNVDQLKINQSINDNDIQAVVTALQEMIAEKDEVVVDHVEVKDLHGLVNGKDFRALDKVTLKTTGDQTIDGWFDLDNLVVGNSAELMGKVSGHSLANMITIGGNEERELIFQKGVNFANHVLFHDLHVKSRMGGLKVNRRGGFNVLLKKSPHSQLLEGETLFDEVKLLEPITLHGKIPNSVLNKMNPNVVVDGEVELRGDYEISGPVTVKRRLTTKDLFCSNEQRSLSDLSNYGIRLNQEVIEGDMVFNQPIKVGNLVAESIRNVPITSLLRSGMNGGPLQVVTGRKIFTSPLVSINGHVEVTNVNGIDIDQFSKTVLTRTGDQNITGNIHFNQIKTYSITSDYVSLGGRDIRGFYARDKDIHVPGVVSFQGSLKPINQFKIGTFYPHGPVFNYSFAELAKDTVFRYETDARVTGKKVFKDKLNIRHLKTTGSYGNLSQVPLDGILRFKLNGDLLADQIKCSNFVVRGNLNGMPGDRFGKFWLSMEGDQIFSEHQTFHNLNVERLQLYGQLEENRIKYDINSAMGNSYLTNRREVVPTKTVFENDVIVQGNLQLLGKLNALRIPEDLILRNCTLIDVLRVEVGNVDVQGEVIVNGKLNDIPLTPLFNFTLNENPYLRMNMKVNGSLEFLREPLIVNLGNVNIDTLYENAWMLYHSRDIPGDVDFEELHLAADIIAEVVNGRNLPHFVANRFSLRQPQRVVERLHFINEVVTHGALISDQLNTGDLMGVSDSNVPINIKYFSENSLKKDTGTLQLVTGDWHFKELNILGDLQGVLINGLNLAKDVVRRSAPGNVVYGGRHFDHLHIHNLTCGEFCYVQGVNLNSWMHLLVPLVGQSTSIQGITILENPEILRDIRVFGAVNGLRFDRESILTKTENQYLNVSLYVNNHFDNKLHQLTVHRLDTELVNGYRIWQDQLDEAVLVTRRMQEQNVVAAPVAFQEKLVVDRLSLEGNTLFGSEMRDVQLNMGVRKLLDEQARGFTTLLDTVERAVHPSSAGGGHAGGGGRYVKYFNILQQIPGADLKYLEPIKRPSRSPAAPPVWTNGSVSVLSPIPASLDDYRLIKVDGAEAGRLSLWGYDATSSKFIPVSSLDFNNGIVALEILRLADGQEIVFLQTRVEQEGRNPQQQQIYWNHFLGFDRDGNLSQIVYEFQSHERIRVQVLTTDKGDVMAQYSPHLDTVDLYEVNWLSGGVRLALKRSGEIRKRAANAVVALAQNSLLLLLEKKQVEIWRFDATLDGFQRELVLSSLVDPIAVVTCTFKGHHLIAVQCAGNVVEISLVLGGSRKVSRYQTLQIKDQVLQLRFVQMTSGELMLAVSTTNGQRPLVVYRYAGLSLFVERLGYSKLGTSGRRISNLIIGEGAGQQPRNFMIIVADREAVILEAITER